MERTRMVGFTPEDVLVNPDRPVDISRRLHGAGGPKEILNGLQDLAPQD
jgi:hypothetical protein